MTKRNFQELVAPQQMDGKLLCVGIDPEFAKLDSQSGHSIEQTLYVFCMHVVRDTWAYAGAYKLNLAFFLAKGTRGIAALVNIVKSIQSEAPLVPIILDAKFGDIGNSSASYAEFAFDTLGADAVTLSPFLGMEALSPFLSRRDKGTIILCKTSNPGSDEFQALSVPISHDDHKAIADTGATHVYQGLGTSSTTSLANFVAHRVSHSWNKYGNCGLVVGATYPRELRDIRLIAGDEVLILAPGIGAQGGDLENTVISGRNRERRNLLINSSRGIIFATDRRKAAKELHEQITTIQGVN